MSMVEKNVKVVETIESVTITLTEDQAQRLTALLGYCTSSSGFTKLWSELADAGIDRKKYTVDNNLHSITVTAKPVW